jgi:RNA polymerase sigma-70 factor (ECF subfamily)
MGPTDEELVAAVQAGDVSAFDVLVSRWDRKIRGAAFRVLRSDEDARDVSQEAFLKAFRGLKSFKQEARFSSWLYQIAMNLCRDRLRRRKGRNHLSLDDVREHAEPALREGPVALAALETRDVARAVTAAVDALSEDHREVVVLKEYEGLTFPEIAEILGLPLSTVKTRLYRALGQLRVELERRGFAC